jgi:hypothetical protein
MRNPEAALPRFPLDALPRTDCAGYHSTDRLQEAGFASFRLKVNAQRPFKTSFNRRPNDRNGLNRIHEHLSPKPHKQITAVFAKTGATLNL